MRILGILLFKTGSKEQASFLPILQPLFLHSLNNYSAPSTGQAQKGKDTVANLRSLRAGYPSPCFREEAH